MQIKTGDIGDPWVIPVGLLVSEMVILWWRGGDHLLATDKDPRLVECSNREHKLTIIKIKQSKLVKLNPTKIKPIRKPISWIHY